ncbi:proteinase [Pseudozyma hubeiensis SY62]|uniref:Proteinase n=1 Tax=Pseudozyma hubeiensis (strain SY62) TaxID=1305764 RepID=R9PEV8_PSEHS|nr:proteinase [Pseudozyma hubeiensis SY62]GAC99782.1 proteinase [Pseudozyma hubeiensis SY62]
MLVADAMNEAVFKACKVKYGDVAGMLTTTFVARDLEQIRQAMAEDQLNGYFVSYGTLIGQIYINMFPDRVGRLVLDGAIYSRSYRLLAAFGSAGLDNVTDSFHDGFLGECVAAGPDKCALAQPLRPSDPLPTKQDLIDTMQHLLAQLIQRPVPGYINSSGPVIVTYSQLTTLLLMAVQDPFAWGDSATALHDLLLGNATLVSQLLDTWDFDPSLPTSTPADHAQVEMIMLVVCSDQYDSPLPAGYDVETNGELWYLDLWRRMTDQAEIGADRNFLLMLACRHWNSTFDAPKEVYRGDLNHTLSNPVLLIGTTYDPATPLRNSRMLLKEMDDNARLIAHHGYGHLSDDKSSCTNDIIRSYLVNGTVPEQPEMPCFADQKPYSHT